MKTMKADCPDCGGSGKIEFRSKEFPDKCPHCKNGKIEFVEVEIHACVNCGSLRWNYNMDAHGTVPYCQDCLDVWKGKTTTAWLVKE